jgi:hypothetical protein
MMCGNRPSTTCNWTLFLNGEHARRALSLRFYAGSYFITDDEHVKFCMNVNQASGLLRQVCLSIDTAQQLKRL